jgi:hypothetical protein
MKELYIAASEELIEEYLIEHPNADWQEAYDATADATHDRYLDKFADLVDAAKMRAKAEGNWPPKPRARAAE